MKTTTEKKDKPVQVRRYSDHPVVQKKVAEARSVFEKVDMSFLDNPPKNQ